MNKDFNELITEVKQIASETIQDVKNHPEIYKIVFNETLANSSIQEINFKKENLTNADGATFPRENLILINKTAGKKWGDNYHKLVMLHELAHYFTYKVSGVAMGHCRTWFYWQHALYKQAFGENKAQELSKYNIARYAGLFNDSGIEPIKKFAKRIGVEFDDIDFNLPNVKNHCSNLLKHSEEFVKVRYFLREIDKANSSLSSFEIQDEINQGWDETLKTIGKNFKNINESLNFAEINKEKILNYYPLLNELTNDEEVFKLLSNHYHEQTGVALENFNKEEVKKHLFFDVQVKVLNHQCDEKEINQTQHQTPKRRRLN